MDKITTITPTRGRAKQVKEVLELLVSKARYPENITFGVRVDDDDTETKKMFMDWKDMHPSVRLLHGKRGDGFLDLHKYVNEIVHAFPADWYYMWDDDMYVISEGWDDIVRKEHKGMKILYDTGTNSPSVVHNDIIECIGHYAQHCAIDSYIEAVTRKLEISTRLRLKVDHRHMHKKWPDERKDQTRRDREKQQPLYFSQFHGKKNKALIAEDREKVMEMLKCV